MNGSIRWLAGVMILAAACLVHAASEKTNFIVILADDMGYGDAGCYGGKAFPTPHLDRLVAEGLRFTDFHGNGAVCSPTRAAFLTGRYPQRSGIDGVVYAAPSQNRHHGLQPGEVTLPALLKQAGYVTGMTGKWHLGYEKKYNPVTHGFDEFRGYVSGNVDYHSHVDGTGVFDWWHNDRIDRESRGYSTHLITAAAEQFIRDNRNKTFFLYVAHEAPHYPYQGPDDPPVREEGGAKALWNDRRPEHVAKAYAQMMVEMDRSIGRIVDAVRETGQESRTLVFFFSDNGATSDGSNGPLRGHKGSLWEGGHRVPAVAWWPGRVMPGRVSGDLALGMDLLPTLLELARVAPPENHRIDGTSLVPVLEGRPLGERRVFWEYQNQQAVREGPWKLVKNLKGQPGVALYHLDQDPTEQKNRAAEEPDRFARMLVDLESWKQGVMLGATRQPEKP